MQVPRTALGKVQSISIIAALLCAAMAPAIMTQQAQAASLISRKITVGSSKVSQADVTYTAVFTTATAGAVEGIVLDFCSGSEGPIIGQSCATGPTGFSTNEAGPLAVSVTGHADFGTTAFTLNAATDGNTVILTRTSATSIPQNTTVTVTLGSTGGSDGITNPSTNGTFYARLLTYSASATAAAYTPTAPGTHTDDGGIALSTANQLTTTARVQEQLQFCVGTLNGAAPSDCSTMSGTVVDIGIIDSGSVAISPVATSNGGNNLNGAAMVRTNAANGVVIDYFAEQAATGTNHLGTLRVSGSSCNAGTSSSDQCFNTSTTQAPFAAGTEAYGLTASSVDTSSGTTTNLVRDAAYDGNGTNAAGNGFAWDESGTFDRLASSSGGVGPENRVVDDEMLVLRFAATSAVTTPTGAYSVTSTYVATATF